MNAAVTPTSVSPMIKSIIEGTISPFVKAGVDLIRTAVSWRNATLDSRTRLAVAVKQSEAALVEAKLRVLINRERLEVVTEESRLDRAHEIELAEFFAQAAQMRQRDEITARRWLFEEQRKLQRELESFRAEVQLEAAEIHHRALIDSVEFRIFLEQLPIKSVPSVLLPHYVEYRRERTGMPLMVIISPPEVDADPYPVSTRLPGIDMLLAGRVGELLARYAGSAERIHFVDGAWKSKSMWGESAFQNLYEAFKPIPTLVLESRIEGDDIHVRFAMWLGNTRMRQGDLGVIPIADVARSLPVEEPSPKRSRKSRKLSAASSKELANTLAHHHALAAAWFADAYHLASYGRAPLLPSVLESLLPEAGDEVIASLLRSFRDVAGKIGAADAVDPASVAVAVARSLADADQPAYAQTQLREALSLWLARNSVKARKQIDIDAVAGAIASVGDLEFLLAVRAVAQRAGDQATVDAIDRARATIPPPRLPDVDEAGDTVYDKW